MLEKEKQCSRCGHRISEGEKYCQSCGQRRDSLPYVERIGGPMACVYGPPMVDTYRCSACSHTWTVQHMGGARVHYCPMCRNAAIECISKM